MGVNQWKMFKNKKKGKQKNGTTKISYYPVVKGKTSPKHTHNQVKRELKDHISGSGKYKNNLEIILEMLKTEKLIDPDKDILTKKVSKETDTDKKAMEDKIFGIKFKTKVEKWVKVRNDLPADKATFFGHIKEMCHK